MNPNSEELNAIREGVRALCAGIRRRLLAPHR